jgi:hypothetical protein
MTKLIIDATLHEKLPALTEPVDLCDAQGRILGRYSPLPVSQKPSASPKQSAQQLPPHVRSLEEILESLRRRQ